MSVVGSPERFKLVPGKIRKVTGRYPEATFAKKCNLRARAHLVTVDAHTYIYIYIYMRTGN